MNDPKALVSKMLEDERPDPTTVRPSNLQWSKLERHLEINGETSEDAGPDDENHMFNVYWNNAMLSVTVGPDGKVLAIGSEDNETEQLNDLMASLESVPQQDDSPIAAALSSIEQAIAANKPVTLSIGPASLEKLRYFLEKPHHDKAVRAAHDVLVQGLSN